MNLQCLKSPHPRKLGPAAGLALLLALGAMLLFACSKQESQTGSSASSNPASSQTGDLTLAESDASTSAPPVQVVSLKQKHATKKWRIYFLNYAESTFVEDCQRGFFDEFPKLGAVKGQNYEMNLTNAQSEMTNLVMMIDNAVSGQADLILLTSTPTLQATIQKVRDIPIIFSLVANPMLAGAGKSFRDHLPNVTGIATTSDFAGMAKVVKECLPQAKRMGTLYVSNEDNSVFNKDAMTAALKKEGIALEALAVSTSSEVADAATALAEKNIDGICQVLGNMLDASFASITQAARKQRKPLFAFTAGQAIKGGAAVVVSRDYEQAGRDMARLAVRVMQGESPAQIPFQMVSKTNLIVNKTNATSCGLSVPPAVLQKADRVIE